MAPVKSGWPRVKSIGDLLDHRLYRRQCDWPAFHQLASDDGISRGFCVDHRDFSLRGETADVAELAGQPRQAQSRPTCDQ